MDIRQLSVFVEVVQCGGFTSAAARLHIAQSAVSIAIQKLEQELGLVLFDRSERKARLTAEGELLYERARLLIAQFKQTQQEMRELGGGHRGVVRLGTSAMLGSYYLPEKIVAFRKRYPQIDFQVNGEGTSRAQEQLLSGEIELAIVNLRDLPPELEAYPLVNESVVACVAKGHPLARRKTLDFGAFAGEQLAVYGSGYYLRELIDEQCRVLGVVPNIALETNILRLMMSLVLSKSAIGFVLERVVLQEPGLKAIHFRQPLNLHLGIAWRKGRYLSVANRCFAEFLLNEAGGHNK